MNYDIMKYFDWLAYGLGQETLDFAGDLDPH